MKKALTLVILIFLTGNLFAQEEENISRITDSIETLGKSLHHSDWASWYGTDVFLAKCPDKSKFSGGYLSYDSGHGWNNIFFTSGSNPDILATISFGYTFDEKKYQLDTTRRKLSASEKNLFDIRYAAVQDMSHDTIFKFYKNTELNPLPIIVNGKKMVYVLTGTNINGQMILGNDYLVDFNSDNTISKIKKLHKNMIVISTKDSTAVATMHTHLPETGEFITATDICTLMSYEKFAPWKTHYVIGKKYISIWNCNTDQLIILTREAFERIAKDHTEGHPPDPPKK